MHLALRDLDHPHGSVVGQLSAEVLVTSVTYPSTTLQIGTVILPKGTIAVRGVQSENEHAATLAVTGGTGKYAEATGTVGISSDEELTITLTRR